MYTFVCPNGSSNGFDLLLKICPLIKKIIESSEFHIFNCSTEECVDGYIYTHIGYDDIPLHFNVWLYLDIIETNFESINKANLNGSLCIASAFGSLNEIISDRGVLIDDCEYGSDLYIDKVLKTIKIFYTTDIYKNKIKRAKEHAIQSNTNIYIQ